MVRHCGGLPLAIKVLGGLLAKRKTTWDWEIVHKDIVLYPQGKYNSMVSAVLLLSYDHLPIRLKPCFLYMGMFPEDYEIPIQKLIRYWIAEKFVVGTSNTVEVLEDIGKCYIHELIERSMVLVGTTDETGLEIKTCRMHDGMRDLCLSKANEAKFLQVSDLSLERDNNEGSSRRLAVHLFEYKELIEEKRNRNPGLRSLVYLIPFNNKFGIVMKSFLDLLFLRVLDLENVTFEGGKLHEDIGRLIHLRYLSLRNCEFTKLPSSLGNLTLMLTLDLRISLNKQIIIPNGIRKMEKLMHLYFPNNCIGERKIELGNLRNLETLENFQVGVMNIEDLFNMVNLRRLSLKFREPYDTKMGHAILNDNFKNLRHLEFRYSTRSVLVDGFINQMVSVCTNLNKLKVSAVGLIFKNVIFSETITSMVLTCCSFEEGDGMSILEKLPNLRYLRRWDASGSQMVCSAPGFPQLRYLILGWLSELEEWRIEKGALPNLLSLEIHNCERLKVLPDGLQFITTLQELKIIKIAKEFNGDRLTEGGEDFHKVQHISSLRFYDPRTNELRSTTGCFTSMVPYDWQQW